MPFKETKKGQTHNDSLSTMVRDFTSIYPRSKSGVRKRLLAYREKILIKVLAKLEGAEDAKEARHIVKAMILKETIQKSSYMKTEQEEQKFCKQQEELESTRNEEKQLLKR